MRKVSIIFSFGLLMLMASCSTISNTATTVGIASNVQQYPTVADLDVSPGRVETSTTWNWNPFAITYPVEIRKQNLIGQLLKEKGADVLVQPEYKYVKEGIFGKRTLTVTGYLAKIKHFRAATDNDIKALAVANGVPLVRLVSQRNVPQQIRVDTIAKQMPVRVESETRHESVKPAAKVKKAKKVVKRSAKAKAKKVSRR